MGYGQIRDESTEGLGRRCRESCSRWGHKYFVAVRPAVFIALPMAFIAEKGCDPRGGRGALSSG